MTIEIGVLLGLILAIISGAAGYGHLKRSVEANEESRDNLMKSSDEQHQNLWKVVKELRDKEEDHIADSNEYRFQTQKEMSMIRETMGSKDGKLDAIVTQMLDLKQNIEDLKDGLKEIRNYMQRERREG